MAYLVFADITHYLVTRWSLALHTQFHSEPSLELVGLLEVTAFQTLLSLLQMLYICSEFSVYFEPPSAARDDSTSTWIP